MNENEKQPGADLYDNLPEDLRAARERVQGKAIDANDRRGRSAAALHSEEQSTPPEKNQRAALSPLAQIMTPEQRKVAGRSAAKEAIEADPDLLDLGPDLDLDPEATKPSGKNEIRFTSTKPDANGLTPQQRKELGKQAARAGNNHSGSGQ